MTEQAAGLGPEGAGPLAEEAVRLLSSVQDWARRTFAGDPAVAGDAPAPDAPGADAPDADAPDADAGHSATGGNCQWCPLCQLVAVLRGDRPEVTARVAEAGTALVTAVRALLEAASGDDAASRSTPPPAGADHPTGQGHSTGVPAPRVQRIDLGDPA